MDEAREAVGGRGGEQVLVKARSCSILAGSCLNGSWVGVGRSGGRVGIRIQLADLESSRQHTWCVARGVNILAGFVAGFLSTHACYQVHGHVPCCPSTLSPAGPLGECSLGVHVHYFAYPTAIQK